MFAYVKKSLYVLLSFLLFITASALNMQADTEPISFIPLSKQLVVESNDVKCPNVVFGFSIVPWNITGTQKDAQGNVLSTGFEGGLYFKEGQSTIAFDSSMSPSDAVYSASTNIYVDDSIFANAAPGVYAYKVSENALPDDSAYEGISTDDSIYTVLVYVTRSDLVNTVSYVLAFRNQTKSDIIFSNRYATNSLSLTKKLAGNQADYAKAYAFTITITGAKNEQYQAVFSNGKTGTIQLESGQASSDIELMDSQTLTIYGLSENDTYTIAEQDYSSLGYSTQVSVNQGTPSDTLQVSGSASNADTSIVYTNTKNLITPTGLFFSAAPYLFLLISALAMILILAKKRIKD
jgi:hypothetical protein